MKWRRHHKEKAKQLNEMLNPCFHGNQSVNPGLRKTIHEKIGLPSYMNNVRLFGELGFKKQGPHLVVGSKLLSSRNDNGVDSVWSHLLPI